MNLKNIRCGLMVVALGATALTAIPSFAQDVAARDVLKTYSDIALAGYEDSLVTAQTLKSAIDTFLADPTEQNLTAARTAWLGARNPYQQTEAYRFGNAIVDDWEGRVNAWPLDEGLIDYVDPSYGMESDSNELYTANVVAEAEMLINGDRISVPEITPTAIAETLHEAGGNEANVASGYHAVEFMLWGQDLNGTGPGAGTRPASDYDLANCTNDNCERRRDYLNASTDLLIADLEEMVSNWQDGGTARSAILNTSGKEGLSVILTGMGSLSYGELAGERMKLGVLLHDPEEEHDCFSDNTHNSHFFDAKGIQNVYLGSYTRIDGTMVEGPSISDYVASIDAALDGELKDKLSATMDRMGELVARAETVEAYDQMIGEGNQTGNATVQAAIDALVDQTRSIERVVAALDIGDVMIEGSDSLDSPGAVFQ